MPEKTRRSPDSGVREHKPDSPDSHVVLAVIGAAHGVQGWVWLNSHTQNPEQLPRYNPFRCVNAGEMLELNISALKERSRRLVAKFAECGDRNGAEALRGVELKVPIASLPVLDSGEYYWFELVGCRVENTDGECLGRVVEMLATGREDIMRVSSQAWEGLIPFARERVVVEVDIAQSLIRVEWQRSWS